MREIWKSTFREIKSSFGRFMAIFAIIALGVGFFAGLKVTKEGMLATVGEYLDKYDFYDFRLISTLGFEQEDVDAFAVWQDVEGAEGSISFDILYRLEDGSQGVVRTYSLTERLNTLKLISGRMPQESNECVADSKMFGKSDIGSTITLSEDNEEEDLEKFAHGEYVIVGLAQSPLYLQYERGNTSLGTGRLDGYVYLPQTGFDVDYYTEIYVKFSQNYDLYSEEYNSFIEGKNTLWEDLTEGAALRRYQAILDETEEKLAEARTELDEKRAEGEKELADAAEELANAGRELADGEQLLADARQELADGEQTIREKEAEIVDARKTIAEKEAEIADGEATVAEKELELLDARYKIDTNELALRSGERQLADGKAEWKSNNASLETTRRLANEGRKLLETQTERISAQKAELQTSYDNGVISEEAYIAGMMIIENEEQSIGEYRARLEEMEEQLREGEEQLTAAWKQIEESEQQLNSGWLQLSVARQQVTEGQLALTAAKIELTYGKQEIENAKLTITEGETALADARKELEEARETLAEKEAEFEDARRQYADGEKEYENALKEFEEKIADAGAEIADAEEKLAELEEPDSYVLDRGTNIGYVCFENDSSIVEGIANIFPVFFFLVAALVCITTMNRMVEEQRTQIGVLKALGYSEFVIMLKYITYSGLAALGGCIFGFFLGTWGFPKILWLCYGIMYQADPIFYVFNGKLALFSLVVSLLCSVGTTWLSCRMELAQVAAALMRPKAPKAGKRVFLEKIPFLWKRLSFLKKVSVRNIFRYKKRLFMMVVGISGCTALLVTGFGIRDSIADIAARQFQEIQIYDISVTLKQDADEDLRNELDSLKEAGIEEYTCVMEKNMDLVTEDGIKSIYLVAGTEQEMTSFLNLHTSKGVQIAYPATGEAVISNKLAEDYNVRIGDMITLRDEEMREFSVTVAAVYENYIYNYVHISEDTWWEQMGEEPERKTVYLNLPEKEATDENTVSAHEVSAELMKLDSVANVMVNADTMERIGNMMKSLNIIVVVVIFCAAGLAFIVLYNLTNINITERVREIATIKVLGFYKKETASYVFRENIILTALGMALGLVLGIFLHRFVMHEIRVDMMNFIVYIKPVSYVYSGLLTIAFAWLVNKFMGGKLENISMTESLKSVD